MMPRTQGLKERAAGRGPQAAEHICESLWKILFNIAYGLFGLIYLPIFLVKIKQATDPKRLLFERMGFLSKKTQVELSGKKIVLMHAVSVGEVMAIRHFLNRFLEQCPDYHIALSTVTPTGQRIAAELKGPRVSVMYFPFDFSGACRRFLKTIQPRCIFLTETEIWPNFLMEASKLQVPVGVLNARLSKRSFKSYRRFRNIFQGLFQKLSFVLAQTNDDANRFITLGVSKESVSVVGNMKLDENVEDQGSVSEQGLRETWCLKDSDRVWIAGSTHPGEEAILRKVFQSLNKQFARFRLVLAPRHIERSQAISREFQKNGIKTVLATSRKENDWEVLILDQLGVLKHLYKMADVVFVGGSLVKKGGQNPIEPAIYQKGILHGPYVFNFKRIYETLDQNGGALICHDGEELLKQLRSLLIEEEKRISFGERAHGVIAELRGATDRHLDWIQLFLSERIDNVKRDSNLLSSCR